MVKSVNTWERGHPACIHMKPGVSPLQKAGFGVGSTPENSFRGVFFAAPPQKTLHNAGSEYRFLDTFAASSSNGFGLDESPIL